MFNIFIFLPLELMSPSSRIRRTVIVRAVCTLPVTVKGAPC